MGPQANPILQLTTLLNISGGGALLALRRGSLLSRNAVLEIPTPPTPDLPALKDCVRRLKFRVLRVTRTEGYDLLGIEFIRPISEAVPTNFPKSRNPSIGPGLEH